MAPDETENESHNETELGDGDPLIELEPAKPAGSEITVYVKGFLGRNEHADHFEAWLDSHERARARLAWGSGACGLRWPAGRVSVPGLPLPIGAAAKVAWDAYHTVAKLRRFNIVGNLALLVGEELARAAVLFASEYRAAERAAAERADVLAEQLAELSRRYERVRLVAHSLGCRHAIEAVGSLPDAERPQELHLCAAACREEEVGAALHRLARERTVLYYAPADLVLRSGFALLSGGSAMGAVGLLDDYEGLFTVDVSERFDFWVHGEYKRAFGDFALPEREVPGP